jgi:hypothetical protein
MEQTVQPDAEMRHRRAERDEAAFQRFFGLGSGRDGAARGTPVRCVAPHLGAIFYRGQEPPRRLACDELKLSFALPLNQRQGV